jgi:DNA polymerase III sliding clamp (beta) subunit (PCNA family)
MKGGYQMKIAKSELQYVLKKLSVANGKNDLVSIEVSYDKAVVTAFDGEGVQMQQNINVTSDEAENGKKFVVHFSKLQDVVSVWKENDIVLLENGGLISLSAPKSKTTVALPFTTTMPELNTEGLEPVGGQVMMQQEELSKGIKELLPLSSSDKFPGFYVVPVPADTAEADGEEKPFNAEESEAPKATRSRLWSSDGGRCHYVDVAGAFAQEIFLPKVACKVIAVLKGELICLIMSGKYLLIKDNENTLVLIRLIERKFPIKALQQLLDNATAEKSAEMEITKADLADALNLIVAVSTDEKKRFSLNFDKGTSMALTISDKSGKGTTDIAGNISCDADMFAPTFSAEQVLQMTSAAPEEKMKIVFTANQLFMVNGGKANYAVCRFTA